MNRYHATLSAGHCTGRQVRNPCDLSHASGLNVRNNNAMRKIETTSTALAVSQRDYKERDTRLQGILRTQIVKWQAPVKKRSSAITRWQIRQNRQVFYFVASLHFTVNELWACREFRVSLRSPTCTAHLDVRRKAHPKPTYHPARCLSTIPSS